MVKKKFTRHTLAFGLTVLASALLYPAAQAGWTPVVWLLLSLVAAAALLALATK
ncbi:MAG: hypothetical protein GXP40_05650 [Chloroflexi bacterium]|nr:hypothetical protein [Chloroflexota bacterium]